MEAITLMAIEKAQELVECNPLFLDTETTGLDNQAEILEISILDINGNIVFHSMVKPVNEIPECVTAIHGITFDDVKNAPKFSEIMPDLISIMSGRKILIYNKEYDIRLMFQSARISGATIGQYKALGNVFYEKDDSIECIMKLYSEYKAIESERGGFKWHKLVAAGSEFGADTTGAHRATADCLMTIEVLKGIANANDRQKN